MLDLLQPAQLALPMGARGRASREARDVAAALLARALPPGLHARLPRSVLRPKCVAGVAARRVQLPQFWSG